MAAHQGQPPGGRGDRDESSSTPVRTIRGDERGGPPRKRHRPEFADDSFDSAASFTMLHHVPTTALQNLLLAEILRVLRPGGVLVGADSLPSQSLHAFHEDDVYNPVEPAAFLVRLQTLGYVDITLGVGSRLTFSAHKPPVRLSELSEP
ncbi:methyltransferase domain-containing protein [Streptomyces sp. M3]|uniref:class I SAM-dependent methyltransferase n=1 Tax=Streptomyces sp. M3 TaxID=295102 RepID=UPI0032208CAE